LVIALKASKSTLSPAEPGRPAFMSSSARSMVRATRKISVVG
jgi:hypothetical protein